MALFTVKSAIGALKDFLSTASNGTSGQLVRVTASGLGLVDPSAAAKSGMFISAEQTGTGASQNVAHGLGATPTKVLIVPTNLPDAAAETGFSVVEGTHTSTNVVVTVTSTVKFKVFAM